MRQVILAMMTVAAGALGQPAKRGDLTTEVARLQQEVALHRQILTNLLQDQQQRDSMLLQLLNARGASAMSALPASAADQTSSAEDGAGLGAASSAGAPQPIARRAPTGRSITGRITGIDGAPLPAGSWVFVQDVSAPARGAVLEIRQQNKTFVPSAAVVQRGTQLVFTNADVVFHDVFSHSPGNTFEINAVRGGTKPPPVAMVRPGVVDVFCNFHSKMTAQILVTPGPLFAKADDQGHFKLDNVPPGRHTLGAWTPNAKPVTTTVDLAGDLAGVELKLKPEREVRPHLNKSDRAYNSYEP
jgi:plastocyanin